jgi:hypothetical protein
MFIKFVDFQNLKLNYMSKDILANLLYLYNSTKNIYIIFYDQRNSFIY